MLGCSWIGERMWYFWGLVFFFVIISCVIIGKLWGLGYIVGNGIDDFSFGKFIGKLWEIMS